MTGVLVSLVAVWGLSVGVAAWVGFDRGVRAAQGAARWRGL